MCHVPGRSFLKLCLAIFGCLVQVGKEYLRNYAVLIGVCVREASSNNDRGLQVMEVED